MMSLATAALVGAGWLVAAQPAASTEVRTVTVVAVGEARSVGDDAAVAHESARLAARQDALRQALGLSVSSATVVRNFEVVIDAIAQDLRGTIVDEQWTPPITTGGMLRTTLRAKVSSEVLAEAACVALRARHQPTIGVVLDGEVQPLVLDALVDALLTGCLGTTSILGTPFSSVEAARQAGTVDLVLVASSYQARGVAVRLSSAGSGQTIVVQAGSPTAVADAIFVSFARQWTRELSAGRRMLVRLRTPSYGTARALADVVATTFASPVAELTQRGGGAVFSMMVSPATWRAQAQTLEGQEVGGCVVVVERLADEELGLGCAPSSTSDQRAPPK